MKKFKVFIDTGYYGCNLEEIFEIEDNATEDKIEKQAFKTMMSLIGWGYVPVEDDDE